MLRTFPHGSVPAGPGQREAISARRRRPRSCAPLTPAGKLGRGRERAQATGRGGPLEPPAAGDVSPGQKTVGQSPAIAALARRGRAGCATMSLSVACRCPAPSWPRLGVVTERGLVMSGARIAGRGARPGLARCLVGVVHGSSASTGTTGRGRSRRWSGIDAGVFVQPRINLHWVIANRRPELEIWRASTFHPPLLQGTHRETESFGFALLVVQGSGCCYRVAQLAFLCRGFRSTAKVTRCNRGAVGTTIVPMAVVGTTLVPMVCRSPEPGQAINLFLFRLYCFGDFL
jgi:hypothetical protein